VELCLSKTVEHGQLDLVLHIDDGLLPSRFQSERLYREDWVCAVAQDSPFGDSLSLKQYLEAIRELHRDGLDHAQKIVILLPSQHSNSYRICVITRCAETGRVPPASGVIVRTVELPAGLRTVSVELMADVFTKDVPTI
jgi:hypothetical protein